MKLIFVTSNRTKFSIAKEILSTYGITVDQVPLDFNEIQAIDVEKVVLNKAAQARMKFKQPLIVDDSGLYIKALNGFPGALLKLVYATMGDKGLLAACRNLDRSATFVSIVVLFCPESNRPKVFTTRLYGKLARSPRGTRRVGWAIERIFIPRGYSKTLAQMNDKEWKAFWGKFRNNLHYTRVGKSLSASM